MNYSSATGKSFVEGYPCKRCDEVSAATPWTLNRHPLSDTLNRPAAVASPLFLSESFKMRRPCVRRNPKIILVPIIIPILVDKEEETKIVTKIETRIDPGQAGR